MNPEGETGLQGLPTADEVLDIIRHDARHHACRQMARTGIRAVRVQGNLLTIAPGTPLACRIIRGRNGTPVPDDQAALFPISARSQLHNRQSTWHATLQIAQHILKERLCALTGIPCVTSPGLNNTLPGRLNNLPAWTTVLTALYDAAREIANTIMGTGPQGTAAHTEHVLREFLGESETRTTLLTFGNNALIGDIKIALQPIVQQARRTSPNAVIFWGNSPARHEPHQTSRYVLDSARKKFFKLIGSTGDRTGCDQEEAWQIFQRLDTGTLRRFPNPGEHIRLIWRAQDAGVNPTGIAARTFLGNPHAAETHPIITQAFLRECAGAAPDRQKLIARQMVKIAGDPRSVRGNKATMVRLTMDEAEPGWDRVLTEFKLEQPSEQPGRPEPRPGKKPGRGRPRRKTLTQQDALEILRGPTWQHVIDALRKAVTVRHDPGERTTLTANGKIVLEVRRSPGGFLEVNGEEWTKSLTIPHTRGGHAQWCTRGAGMRALEQHGLKVLMSAIARDESLSKKRALGALREFALDDLQGIDPHLSGALLTGVQSLVNVEAWSLAKSRSKQVTQHRYNTALGALGDLRRLGDTNATALEWALAYAEPREEIRHPGQIIELARTGTQQAGLSPDCWRRATNLPAKISRRIIENTGPRSAAIVLQAIAQAGAIPEENTALAALQVLVKNGRREADHEPMEEGGVTKDTRRDESRKANLNRTLHLLFRESKRLRESQQGRKDQDKLVRQIPDVRDYLNSRNARGLPVRQTTWNGLLKASHAWHRQIRMEPIVQRWERILLDRQGEYLRWTSPVGTTEIDGLTIIPLLDERDLYKESLEMLHCVIDYGKRCASGQSLVVSIREDGKRIATGELVRTGQGWQEQQTRGVRNHWAPERAVQAVRRMAEICNGNPQEINQPG